MASSREQLGQILKRRGVVREGQVQEALAMQRERPGVPLGRCLVELGLCAERDVLAALAEQAGLELVDLPQGKAPAEAAALLDASTARTFTVLPIRVEGNSLVIAIGDPMNLSVLDDLRFLAGREIRAVFADPGRIRACIDATYGADTGGLKAAVAAARGVSASGDAKEM